MLTTIERRAARLSRRLAHDESGFSLVELLTVLVIMGILLAIAIPSYLGFKTRAERSASFSVVRQGIPAAEAYYADNGGYSSMTPAILKASYDAGIKLTGSGALAVTAAGPTSYSLRSTVGNCIATFTRPGTTINNSC